MPRASRVVVLLGMPRVSRVVVLLMVAVFPGCLQDSPVPVRIFAAASLADVMEVLADSFEVATGGEFEVRINVAATSLLARQIERGARADVFISAHPAWTDYLRDREKISEVDTLPISNRLVVATRTRGVDLTQSRIALADPDHVPAGVYARQALECAGVWDHTATRVVPTLDVRAALSAVEEGAADAAIVYASDALLAPGLVVGEVVADTCQPEIQYTVALGRSNPSPGSRKMLSYLLDPERSSVWSRYGFEVTR